MNVVNQADSTADHFWYQLTEKFVVRGRTGMTLPESGEGIWHWKDFCFPLPVDRTKKFYSLAEFELVISD